MNPLLGRKVLCYFLFAICSVVECRKIFEPRGPAASPSQQAAPASQQSPNKVWGVSQLGRKSKEELKKFLGAYGYGDAYSNFKKGELAEGVKDFQYFAGLPTTGNLDAETIKMINTDRCGMKDPSPREKRLAAEQKAKTGRSGRWRRYNKAGSEWRIPNGARKVTLTWQYLHDPLQSNARDDFTAADVRKTMIAAMAKWTAVTNVEFKEVRTPFTPGGKDEPDILVRFIKDDGVSPKSTPHYRVDMFPFDGQGGTLAHAFYPMNNLGLSGDVHFDDDEYFTVNGKRPGVDLMWVATHELGHSLGLDHSRNQDAIMFPYYGGFTKSTELHYDDKLGIQDIYGGKERTIVTKCPASDITAVWDSKGKSNYLVLTKDQKLFQVSKDNKGVVETGVPKSKYYDFDEPIDAVYQTNFGRTTRTMYDVVFTNKGYYLYRGFGRVSGPHPLRRRGSTKFNFCNDGKEEKAGQRSPENEWRRTDPRTLKVNFPKSVTKIDAVLKWQRNNKVYFFTGNNYYRFDEKKEMFDCGYPRLISTTWRGLPESVDSAYSSKENTFFTKEDKIYYFNDRSVTVKEAGEKNARRDLLKC